MLIRSETSMKVNDVTINHNEQATQRKFESNKTCWGRMRPRTKLASVTARYPSTKELHHKNKIHETQRV